MSLHLLPYSVQFQHFEDWHFERMPGYFCVYVFWYNPSDSDMEDSTFKVCKTVCDLRAYVYTRETSVYLQVSSEGRSVCVREPAGPSDKTFT